MNDISAIKLSKEQDDIIIELINNNCSDNFTRLMIIMCTGAFARVEDELIGILIEYPGMEDADKVRNTLHMCINKNYLSTVDNQGSKIIFQDEAAFNTYLGYLKLQLESRFYDDIVKRIRRCREAHINSNCVKDYGLLSGGPSQGAANTTFLNRLREAKQEILLPMLNTNAHTATIEILRDRAKKGVKIKILLADYEKISKKVRGRPDTTHAWLDAFALQKIPNVEIRVYYNLEDCILSSSVIIDNDIVRLVVVDPIKEKTTNGTLIECYKHGYRLNITKLMRDKFYEIWERSQPLYPKKRTKFQMIVQKKGVIPAVVGILLLVLSFSVIPAKFTDISKNFAFMFLGMSMTEIRSWCSNILGRMGKLFIRLARLLNE